MQPFPTEMELVENEWGLNMLEGDEEALEHLAEADLAYLEMVRTKAGLQHVETAGAMVASEAEQALAAFRACAEGCEGADGAPPGECRAGEAPGAPAAGS